MVDAGGGIRPGVLLGEDHLADEARTASPDFLGPREPDPARLTEAPLPGQPELEALVLAPRSAEAPGAGELPGQTGLEPVPHLGPERLVLLGETHSSHVTCTRAL